MIFGLSTCCSDRCDVEDTAGCLIGGSYSSGGRTPSGTMQFQEKGDI